MSYQPISNNGLKPSGFMFSVERYPDVNFPIQSVTIPSVSIGTATQNSPLTDIKWPSEKVTYQNLPIRFMLNENLDNYIALFGWMKGIAAPLMPTDFPTTFRRFEVTQDPDTMNQFSDLSLHILDSKNNPTVGFTFHHAYPSYIGQIQMDTTIQGEEYLYVDTEFTYTYFTVDKL